MADQIFNFAGVTGIGVLTFHVYNFATTNKRKLREDIYKSVFEDGAEGFVEDLKKLAVEILGMWQQQKLDELKAATLQLSEIYEGHRVLMERHEHALSAIQATSVKPEILDIHHYIKDELGFYRANIQNLETKVNQARIVHNKIQGISKSEMQSIYRQVLGTERLLKEKSADIRKLFTGALSDFLLPGIGIGVIFTAVAGYMVCSFLS